MQDMARRSPPKLETAASVREASRRDNERPAAPTKRVFTAEYKQRVLHETDLLAASGERGAVGRFLRREGLYNMQLQRWRAERKKAEVASLEPKKRGPKSKHGPEHDEVERLRRQVERLQTDLKKAEIIIDVQKKLSALLGIQMPANPDEDEKP